MESREAMANTRITLSVAMAVARALLDRVCEDNKVRQREEKKTTRRGRKNGRGHQSVWLNHWQRSCFKTLHIKSRCREWRSRTDIKSVISLFPGIHSSAFFSPWAEKVLWISHFEILYYPSITSLHNVLQHRRVQKNSAATFPNIFKTLVFAASVWSFQGH